MSKTVPQLVTQLMTYFFLIIVMMAATPESKATVLMSAFLAYITAPAHTAFWFLWMRKFTKEGIYAMLYFYMVILPKYIALPFAIFFLCMGISFDSPYLHPVWMACVIIQKIVGGGLVALGNGIYTLFHGSRWDLWLIFMMVEVAVNMIFFRPKTQKENIQESFARYKARQAADIHVHNDRIRVVSEDEFLQITEGTPRQLPKRSTAGTRYV